MKITKTQLKQIIKEEVSKVLGEAPSNVPDADAFRAWLTRASENVQGTLDESYLPDNLTLEETRVGELCYELEQAINQMGSSNPELTEAYLAVFRALKYAGLNLKALAMMS